MNPKFIEFTNKHTKAKKENRVYQSEPSSKWVSYGCSYDDAFLKLDIDDYDKSGKLEEPINGKPRSDVVVALLEEQSVKFNGIKTEKGKHLFFRVPDRINKKTVPPWYSVLGIKCEWKFPASDDHIPLVINGVERQFFKGSITNTDVDELPFYLFPLQKSKNRPFDLSISSGNRTNSFGAYLFHLINKGFTADEAAQIVRLMNAYVLEEPISDSELNATTLNDSTIAKLKDRQREKELTADIVADEIIKQFKLIFTNGDYFSYQNGVYRKFNIGNIRKHISYQFPKKTGQFEREVIRHVEGRSFTEPPEDNGIVNVKNGLLRFDEEGNVTSLPHSRDHISFRQFNADYDPESASTLLENTLNQWFSDSDEQVELFDQMLGYLLMNHTRYQKAFFFIGQPSSGKTTALDMITNFCGLENVSSLSLDALTDKQSLASLVNKTVNIRADLPNKKIYESGTFKSLVSGDTLTVNPKYIREYSYKFTGKLIFGMNELPDYSSDDKGVDRRVAFFTFNRIFKEGTEGFNQSLSTELQSKEVMSTLLNHAIRGYKSLIQRGYFISTKESKRVQADFITVNNNIELWIKEASIDKDYLLREPINHHHGGIYPDYQSFCFNAGVQPKEQQSFSRYIAQKYVLETYRDHKGGDRIRFFRPKT